MTSKFGCRRIVSFLFRFAQREVEGKLIEELDVVSKYRRINFNLIRNMGR